MRKYIQSFLLFNENIAVKNKADVSADILTSQLKRKNLIIYSISGSMRGDSIYLRTENGISIRISNHSANISKLGRKNDFDLSYSEKYSDELIQKIIEKDDEAKNLKIKSKEIRTKNIKSSYHIFKRISKYILPIAKRIEKEGLSELEIDKLNSEPIGKNVVQMYKQRGKIYGRYAVNAAILISDKKEEFKDYYDFGIDEIEQKLIRFEEFISQNDIKI
jgi:hypothetical protein